MPKILDKELPVVMGNCIRVANVDKKKETEPNEFICIQVESENGEDEYPILLTQAELDSIQSWTPPEMKNWIAGRIYPMFLMGRNYYCVRVRTSKEYEFVGLFDITNWIKYFKRAVDHPESCTKKGIITDILD